MKKILAAFLIAAIGLGTCSCSSSAPVESSGSDAGKVKAGDIIKFGNYKGHTDWRVLNVVGTEAYITSNDIVDTHIFDESYCGWDSDSCSIRLWLNDEYINEAFTDAERDQIVDKTGDKILLMSVEEAYRYFKDDADRYFEFGEEDAPGYWLRNRGIVSDHASLVECDFLSNGHISEFGAAVNYEWGVRPALWIRLDDGKVGNTVSSEVFESGPFIFSKTGPDTDLTGLTEEGKKQEDLVIPAGVRIFTNFSNGHPKNVSFESDDDVDYGYLLTMSNTLETVTLPKGLTKLGFHSNCPHLKELVIPKGVKEIPVSCFHDDTGLEKIVIEGNLTTISNMAFGGCGSLKNIDLPDSVTSIGAYAFIDCDSLREITLPKGLKKIGEHAFVDSGRELVIVPEEMELEEWPSNAFAPSDEELADPDYTMFGPSNLPYTVRVKKGSWADTHFDEVFSGKVTKEYY
ncbi:MAG: leucine-rich repeat domain-containing protein [Clostridiales bacterium]|nr:leucine-rich repeat domain-containing protein [Clostridiales bacterium]